LIFQAMSPASSTHEMWVSISVTGSPPAPSCRRSASTSTADRSAAEAGQGRAVLSISVTDADIAADRRPRGAAQRSRVDLPQSTAPGGAR
jgi:hypothetical protein